MPGDHPLASVISQIIGNLHPGVAEVSEATKERFKNAWLEGLEEHTGALVSELVEQMREAGEPPEAIASLLDAVHAPTAQFGSLVQQFFVFGVMFNLADAMLGPFVQQVQNNTWHANPDRPLTAADIATALTQAVDFGGSQGVEVPQWALDEAASNGVNAERFKTLVGIDGVAPDPTLLFEMYRREIIDDAQLQNGFLEGPTKNKWIPSLTKLQYSTPSAIDLVNGAIRSIDPENPNPPTEAGAGGTGTGPGTPAYDNAKKWAAKLGLEPANWVGGNPDWFDFLASLGGRPPGPVELGHMVLRGIIPYSGTGAAAVTFQQGIAESDLKTKWTDALWQLMQYVPPAGEVRTLLLHGGIDDDQALALWKANGVPDDIAQAYLHLAKTEQITQDKALAKGDIETLIQEQVVTDEQATELLAQIGYSGDNAAFIVSMAHFRYELEALRTATRNVANLYTRRKITASEAKVGLEALGLPAENITHLLDVLTAQRDAEVLIPTAGQITTAAYYNVIDQPTALAALENLGYGTWDAWLVLSARLHTAAGPEPSTASTIVAGAPQSPGSGTSSNANPFVGP